MILVVGIIVVLAILAIVIGVTRTENASETATETNEESIFPKGPQTYQVSSNEPGPKVREVVVSELEPKSSEDQVMRVRVDDPSEVREVSIAIVRDATVEEHTLVLVEGTKQNGWWQGSWKLSGTTHDSYAARIVTENATAGSTVTITFR